MTPNLRSFRMKWLSLPSLFLALLLATPEAVRAQERGDAIPHNTAHVPGTAPAPRLRLLEDPSAEAPPRYVREPSSTGGRILAEIGLGLGVPFVLSIATGVGALACQSATEPSRTKSCQIGVGLTGVALSALGLPLGVWLGGRLTGGRGYFLGALLGALTGAAAGFGAIYGASRLENPLGPLVLSILFAVVAPLAGSIAGYEISATLNPPEPTPGTKASLRTVRLSPMVAALPGGATMGLGGTF